MCFKSLFYHESAQQFAANGTQDIAGITNSTSVNPYLRIDTGTKRFYNNNKEQLITKDLVESFYILKQQDI